MPDLTQSSFTAGEVDPALWGRKDQGIYSSGLRRAVNMVVHEGGGIYNREGFRFVGRIKDEEVGARLLHFRFTSGDEYIIEAGVQYFRFWRDNAAVLEGSPSNITAVTKDTETTVTLSNSHGIVAGDQFYIQGCVGIPEINERMYKAGVVDGNDVVLTDPSYGGVNTDGTMSLSPIDSSEWTGAWTSGGTMDRPYELAFNPTLAHATADKIAANTNLVADDRNVGPPYAEQDLPFIDYQQTGDIVTMVHPAHPIYELKRFGHTNWRMEIKAFPDTVHTSTNDMGEAVMTTVNSGDFFGNDSTNVMNYLYNRDGDPSTDNTSEQTGEYPSIIGFFQQRRVLSGRGATPDTVFYSAIGDYDDFVANPNVTADSAFRATLATPTLSSIVAAVSLREDIIFLTDDSVWGVRSAGPGFTAANLFQAPQSRIPADPVRPVNFDDDVLFVRKGGRSLISVRFDNNSGRYTPIDLSLSARQIFSCGGTRAGLIQTFFDRLRRVVVPNGEGQLAHLSVNLPYNLTAWTRWVTEGEFEASGVTLGDESYYTVIKRTVGGRTRRFIEVNHPHRRDRQIEDQFFVDSGLTYAGDGTVAPFTFSYMSPNADPNELCPEEITVLVETTQAAPPPMEEDRAYDDTFPINFSPNFLGGASISQFSDNSPGGWYTPLRYRIPEIMLDPQSYKIQADFDSSITGTVRGVRWAGEEARHRVRIRFGWSRIDDVSEGTYTDIRALDTVGVEVRNRYEPTITVTPASATLRRSDGEVSSVTNSEVVEVEFDIHVAEFANPPNPGVFPIWFHFPIPDGSGGTHTANFAFSLISGTLDGQFN